MSEGICRCEATIAKSVLEGYSCGNTECWRTARAQESFDAFVKALVAKRGDTPPPSVPPPRV